MAQSRAPTITTYSAVDPWAAINVFYMSGTVAVQSLRGPDRVAITRGRRDRALLLYSLEAVLESAAGTPMGQAPLEPLGPA